MERDSILHRAGSSTTAWTRVNTIEAVPSTLTPLSASAFWDDPSERGLHAGYAEIGVLPHASSKLPPSADERIMAIVYGRLAANVDTVRHFADRMPGTSGDSVELSIFGSLRPGIRSEPSRRRYPVIAAKMPYAVARLPGRVHATRRQIDTWWRDRTITRPPATPEEARTLLAEASARFSTAMRYHLEATMIAQAFFEQISALSRASGREGAETTLCTGYGGLEESQVLQGLWAASRGRLPVADLVTRFGFLGQGTGELAKPSWRQDPTALERLVEVYRQRTAGTEPAEVEREQAARRRAAVNDLLGNTSVATRSSAKVVFELARRYIPLREVGKAAYVQVIDAGRCAATALGDHLAGRGYLDEPGDVFNLGLHELLDGATDGLRSLVAERRQLHTRYDALDVPLNWVGEPALGETDASVPATTVLKGLPVCAGRVEGVVRVVTDPDVDAFAEGEILACVLTDPSWMPLLSMASAAVIDIGGPMSHCAISARELGIPAVINTKDGTRVLRTGDRVRVDGAAGTVEILQSGHQRTE